MIELNIPGRGVIQLDHLVTDVNGTLALDGRLNEGVAKALLRLSDRLEIHMLTADTHGQQDAIDRRLGLQATRIQMKEDEVEAKRVYVQRLGGARVAALGQGANDAGMLAEAAIGVAVLSPEGLAQVSLRAADLLVSDVHSALALFENPLRLVASLRR